MVLDNYREVEKIDGKYYDFGTSNRSFVKVAEQLHEAWVTNWYFMLEICDTSLAGVNPYAPDLTEDQKCRIIVECSNNLWYYLREVVRIPIHDDIIPFEANRGTITQAWCFLHGIDSWLCLPRGQKKTFSLLAVFSWINLFSTEDIVINITGRDINIVSRDYERFMVILHLIPDYMKRQIMSEMQVGDNHYSYHDNEKNTIMLKSGPTTKDDAIELARSLTGSFLYFDDVEYIPHMKTILAESDPSYQKIKETHDMYGRCFTSVPGDLETEAGREAFNILYDTTKWSDRMFMMEYDKNNKECELLKYVNDKIVYIEFYARELGLPDDWEEKMARKIANQSLVDREIYLKRNRPKTPEEHAIIENIKEVFTSPEEENPEIHAVMDELDKFSEEITSDLPFSANSIPPEEVANDTLYGTKKHGIKEFIALLEKWEEAEKTILAQLGEDMSEDLDKIQSMIAYFNSRLE